MKDISIYFKPVDTDKLLGGQDLLDFAKIHTEGNFPVIKDKGVALLYVPEYQGRKNESSYVDVFRESFYQLSRGDYWSFSLYDLGTIEPGETIDDTYFALSQVVSELLKKDIIPFVIGGSHDLTIPSYRGFESQEQMINICSIDSTLDIGDPNKGVKSDGFISHLLMHRPCYLFNYTTVGVQRPYTKKKDLELFDKLYFDVCRLGELNDDYKIVEPFVRNSDILTIDFKSIKSSDTDVSSYSNPNGISASQICQIAKYAGLSDKMSCVGIFDIVQKEFSPSSPLIAQIIWYFIDGVSQRVGDFPIGTKKSYTKFYVHLEDFEDDLVFYKSNKSQRWWMEVQYNPSSGSKYDRHYMVPCNKEDYDKALENIIPDLWWKTIKKLD